VRLFHDWLFEHFADAADEEYRAAVG